MRNMLEDDKTRLGLASGGNDSSILDKRLQAMIENEIKLVQEYGDDYFKSGTGKILGRFRRGLGASGEGLRTFTNMRTANNQMGDMYTNEELASMLNTGFENAGLENRFTLPEDLQTRERKAEGKLVGDQKKLDANNDGQISEEDFKLLREQKQEGGSMDDQMQMIIAKEETPNMIPDEEMEDNYLDFIIDEALDEEEEDMLMSKLEQDEQLSMLFDKVLEVASEFAGSGPVEGPGSGVSDSIPARLSDGEFVFTAKATEQIGADELMRMMKDAEADADRQGMQEGGMMMEEEEVDQFGRPIDSDIARDELKKNMMSVNPRYR